MRPCLLPGYLAAFLGWAPAFSAQAADEIRTATDRIQFFLMQRPPD